MSMSNPAVFLNSYLSEMVPRYLEEHGYTEFNYFDEGMRFFPVSPTTINELTEQLPSATEAPFVVYDRMFRFKKYKFPHIKCEQMLYYFYKTTTASFESATASLIETSQAVYDLLSRGDESAQEVNSWIEARLDSNGKFVVGSGSAAAEFSPVYFHQTSVFQLEEIRDIIDFGTARTYAGNKIIIDYDYHIKDFNGAVPTTIRIAEAEWAGGWSSSTQYTERDVVGHSGSFWIALDSNINTTPGNNNLVWRELSSRIDDSQNVGTMIGHVMAYNIPVIDTGALYSGS